MDGIEITEEMRIRAKQETEKRAQFVRSRDFQIKHMTIQERGEVGFLGEFACCRLLNIDWRSNIRKDYFTADDFDFKINGLKVDVKTETIPDYYANKILNGEIGDDETYGRRLINGNQFQLLKKYDVVVFSFFIRDRIDRWFPIGWLESKTIIEKYPPSFDRPDGGKYPFSGSPVKTSDLKPMYALLQI